MTSLALVAFFAGALTILAPCVLPVLPVVLAGSLTEKQKWYPYLVTLSLAISVVLFTVVLKATTALIDIPPSFWKGLSGGILIALGLVYIFPHAWAWIAGKLGFGRSNVSLDKAQDISSPVVRAIATGAALGPVFSTCSPTYAFLLATVFPVSLVAGIGYTLIYALGLSLMLTIIAVGGRSIIARFRGIADEKGWFKRVLGIVFVLIGLAIIAGVDKKIETWVLDRFDVSAWEQKVFDSVIEADAGEMPGEIIGTEIVEEISPAVVPVTPPAIEPIVAMADKTEESSAPPREEIAPPVKPIVEKKSTVVSSTPIVPSVTPVTPPVTVENPLYPIAPEITLTDWIDSPPLTMKSLRGKVVLIDFWTLGCINCQRTRPYLNAWYEKYKSQGLVIIGVHAPEFAYEKVRANVEKAIQKEKIAYPVVLDPDFELWNAYENRYWPAFYFVDKRGYVRHSHFGEGSYEENEKVIQALLAE